MMVSIQLLVLNQADESSYDGRSNHDTRQVVQQHVVVSVHIRRSKHET